MKRHILCVLTILSITFPALSQNLVNHTLLQSLDSAQVINYLTANGVPIAFVAVTNGMDIYKITYNTVSYDSSATIATGTVFVPQGLDCGAPVMVYNHGTVLEKAGAPSNQTGEYVIGVAFAADGIAVVMPDYLGLGDSPGLHPYIHAQSEATCVIDMVRASRELFQLLSFQTNPQVFLTGYSQGGHTTMAAHKMMEENFPQEFQVACSAPLSGPYDASGVQAEVITKDSSYDAPGYLPFVLFSYNMVYNLYSNWSDVLQSPYDTLLPPLMDGSVGLGYIEGLIPDTPNLILQPALLDSFKNFPNHPFRQVLRLNDLYRWAPQAPVRMYYCEADQLVSYKNALVAKDSLIAYGAADVEAYSAGPILDHQGCALYALLNVKFDFDDRRNDRPAAQIEVHDASDGGSNDGSATVHNTGGYPPYTYTWSSGGTDSTETGLSPGIYSVTVEDQQGCGKTFHFTIGVVGIEEEWMQEIILYPNPVTENLFIRNSQNTKVAIRLTDISGRVLQQYLPTDAGLITIPMVNMAAGTYILEMESDGRVMREKILR